MAKAKRNQRQITPAIIPVPSGNADVDTETDINVGYVRKEIADLQSRYDLIRDCLGGEEQVKKQRTKYLPKPNAEDTSDENKVRYDQYLCRAVFYGVTGRTVSGLIGQVFKKDPTTTLPPTLEILKGDVSGGGVELQQQAQGALEKTIAYGRCGLLVDFPQMQGETSKADLEAGKIQPFVMLWDAWDIINWRTITVNGKVTLSLVVISEQFVSDDDGFEEETEDQFRVLRLKDGIYVVELWRQTNSKTDAFGIAETFVPLNSKGQPWEFIPFQFIGAKNNDSTPDLPPMYDLAALNMAHYRNSADFEESCFMVGQPTPYASGLTQEWVKDVLKGELHLGSRGVIMLPPNGQAGLLQVQENSMPEAAMRHKEEQMRALGAKLLESGQVQKSATEATQTSASESSILATCAGNVSKAYTKVLEWAGLFIGVEQATTEEDGKLISFELNTDFELALNSPQDRAQLVSEWQANAISKSEMRTGLKAAGSAYLDDDAYETEIEADGVNLGVPAGSEASRAEDAAKAASDAKQAALDAKGGQKTGLPAKGKGKPVPAKK